MDGSTEKETKTGGNLGAVRMTASDHSNAPSMSCLRTTGTWGRIPITLLYPAPSSL